MSCISISVIGFAHNVALSTESMNKSLSVEATNINTSTEIEITALNKGVLIGSIGSNRVVSLENTALNKKVTIQVGLICSIGPNLYTYLQVLEGDVILIDGEYLKVLRDGV